MIGVGRKMEESPSRVIGGGIKLLAVGVTPLDVETEDEDKRRKSGANRAAYRGSSRGRFGEGNGTHID